MSLFQMQNLILFKDVKVKKLGSISHSLSSISNMKLIREMEIEEKIFISYIDFQKYMIFLVAFN